ncbi:zinc-binding dehydrogenase [candidate division WOR-3 bacterium]|nr:zinc-binding dehydrogenase [candidate division WOR-3 bacterium]
MKIGCKYGTHRVIEPKGTLPQAAWRIDNSPEIYDNEILLSVRTLNIDSASFTQIKKQSQETGEEIASIIKGIVKERGKHHNPVTGSGGMLIGTVAEIGKALKGKIDLQIGDKIATLVSLSLTPLVIDEILEIRTDTDQIDIKGKAILFESGIYAKLPLDMSERLALAVLDVAGAPAQVARLVGPGQRVLIIGASGKSGLLCLYEAKKRTGVTGQVIAFCHSDRGRQQVEEIGMADVVLQGDAQDAISVMEKVSSATEGKMADLTINCVSIPNTEMGSILATRDGGTIYFFSMATSFTAAALGAEGVGKDVTMLIGNGYAAEHAKIALKTLRENQKLRTLYESIYS